MSRRHYDESRLLAGDPCQEEEDEFDEDQDEVDGYEENATESDPNDLDMSDGYEPPDYDPNVDIDVETETDADVDAEIEVEADADVGVEITADELFFEAEVESGERVGIDYVSGSND